MYIPFLLSTSFLLGDKNPYSWEKTPYSWEKTLIQRRGKNIYRNAASFANVAILSKTKAYLLELTDSLSYESLRLEKESGRDLTKAFNMLP